MNTSEQRPADRTRRRRRIGAAAVLTLAAAGLFAAGTAVGQNPPGFTDLDHLPVEHREAVGWAADCGLIRGGEDGLFHPDRPVTRAQMVLMFQRWAETGGDCQAASPAGGSTTTTPTTQPPSTTTTLPATQPSTTVAPTTAASPTSTAAAAPPNSRGTLLYGTSRGWEIIVQLEGEDPIYAGSGRIIWWEFQDDWDPNAAQEATLVYVEPEAGRWPITDRGEGYGFGAWADRWASRTLARVECECITREVDTMPERIAAEVIKSGVARRQTGG